eukprot:UN04493
MLLPYHIQFLQVLFFFNFFMRSKNPLFIVYLQILCRYWIICYIIFLIVMMMVCEVMGGCWNICLVNYLLY